MRVVTPGCGSSSGKWRRTRGPHSSVATRLGVRGPPSPAKPSRIMTSILRRKLMKTMGIREAKAHLSQVVRDAAMGECCLVTDNRNPVEAEHSSPPPTKETRRLSDAAEFRKALFAVPFPIEVDF